MVAVCMIKTGYLERLASRPGRSGAAPAGRGTGDSRLGAWVGNDVPGGSAGFLASLSAGSQVAGYRLQERIGQGGMAVVFRAFDERLHRQVALKILTPAIAGGEAFRRRFIRESRSAAAVDDPHIVPVFEAGTPRCARPG